MATAPPRRVAPTRPAAPRRTAAPAERPAPRRVALVALLILLPTLVVLGLLGVGGAGLAAWQLGVLGGNGYTSEVYRLAPGDYPLYHTIPTREGEPLPDNLAFVFASRVAWPPAGAFSLQGMDAATDGMTVERITAEGGSEQRPLRDALGSWVNFTLSDGAVCLMAPDQQEARSGVRYVLHVPGDRPMLLGGSPEEVEKAGAGIAGRKGAAEAVRRLDDYVAQLRGTFGDDSGVTATFYDAVRPVEQSWLQGGGDAGQQVEERIDAFVKSLSDPDHPRETLYLLSVAHGDVLSAEQIAGARRVLGVPVADGYHRRRAALAPRPDAAGILASLCTCVAADDDAPDDFEGVLTMLLWATEYVRGPDTKLIDSRKYTVGDVEYTEYHYEITYFRSRADNLRRAILASFRSLGKAAPAAQRLLKALQLSGGGGAPPGGGGPGGGGPPGDNPGGSGKGRKFTPRLYTGNAPLYRGVAVGEAELERIFEAGFTAKGDIMDLYRHFDKTQPDSGYVAATTDLKGTAKLAAGGDNPEAGGNGYVFVIDPEFGRMMGIDANATFGPEVPNPQGCEVSFPRRIPRRHVRGAFPVRNYVLGDASSFIENPFYGKE